MNGHALERSVRIVNRAGLHARPAAQLVKLASRFACEIEVGKEGLMVNAKSIMGVLMLAAPKDSRILVKAVGPDAEAALSAIGELIGRKFGEE
jgi:phosphocarrier protein